MNNFDKSGPPNKYANVNQVVLQAKLRVAQSGVEMLDFTIPLGMMELHCSCPIPDEDTEGSPVYVHMRPARSVGAPRPADNMRQRRQRPAPGARDYGVDHNASHADDHDDPRENFGNRA